ncbi:MAG TPA: hypothetical protein VFL94_09455 [Actinomycetales bacterium]|nr:hypothetical protein [Actinomycetales bacterium]
MSRAAPAGRLTPTARYPGEAFGLAPGAGAGVLRGPSFDVGQVAAVRVWSLRLRLAAEAQSQLGGRLLSACDDAGLVGPAGDALRVLGESVSECAVAAAQAAGTAADVLDRVAMALTLHGVTEPGADDAAVRPAASPAGRRP